jgi:hypothetical protein|tara:strand:- start:1669 stop:2211 length:543 start_codon:yes stop_codon:yes gene_type:complete
MIKLMEMVKYRHIRPYTKVEMNQITDEYLNNNKFKEVMPNFAKDKDDVLTKLQDIDKLEYLSEKELSKLNNSKIPSIMSSGKDVAHLIGQERFNYKEIYDGIKSVPPKKFTPPLVVKDKTGKLFMLDGDDKLTIFVALGSNLPVKKVNYSRKFNQEYMEYYNKAHMNDLSSHAGSIGVGY